MGGKVMWMHLGFFTMGLFVGNLVGLSATSLVSQLIGLFFALAGGSVIAFLKGLEKAEQKIAGQALFCASAGALLGVYLSVLAIQFRLLTPRIPAAHRPVATQPAAQTSSVEPGFVLPASDLNGIIEESNAIHRLYRQETYSLEEAYDKTYRLIHGGPPK
jgi:hypothetical protein